MGGMFGNIGSLSGSMFGSGLASDLANNVIMPGVNRLTGGGSTGDIGARLFQDSQPPKTFLTPQEQVQQSQANGGILRIRGQQPGMGQMPGGAFMGQPVEYPGQMPGGVPQQGNQQYYQQMRESMSNMDKALKELEGIQTPGGQYNAVGGMSQGNAGK